MRGGSMMNITVLGVDLAKNVFQLHGVDASGKVIVRKQLTRAKLIEFVINLPPCLIGMEACASSYYWARRFQQTGHEVKLISPQFVKPYVKSNKSDRNDAEAICEAVTRPNMRFVAIKSTEQQDIQAIHRIRSGLVQRRTALANQTRGLLGEYGIVVPQGIKKLNKQLPLILEDAQNGLSDLVRELFADLYEQFKAVDKQVKKYDAKLEQLSGHSEVCQRLIQIPGVGAITATAIAASVGDAKVFKNGREMAAWLGLVPRQHSSGGKSLLLGISKRGDRYLRTLLIHGARAVMSRVNKTKGPQNIWLKQLMERRGNNKASVALANKNARVIWALMAKGAAYQPAI
jgi:transposase